MSCGPAARTMSLTALNALKAATRPPGLLSQRSRVLPCAMTVLAMTDAISAHSMVRVAAIQLAGCSLASLGQRAWMTAAAVWGTASGSAARYRANGNTEPAVPRPALPGLAARAGPRDELRACKVCGELACDATACSAAAAASFLRTSSTGWNKTTLPGSTACRSSSKRISTDSKSHRAAPSSSHVITALQRGRASSEWRTCSSTSAGSTQQPSRWGTPQAARQ
ncbi:hypothetical protein V8C86DRAFT_2796244 [Haematococcus lacustris]